MYVRWYHGSFSFHISFSFQYPCSRVLVNITTSSGRIMKTNVTLYDKYETFQLQAHTKQVTILTSAGTPMITITGCEYATYDYVLTCL